MSARDGKGSDGPQQRTRRGSRGDFNLGLRFRLSRERIRLPLDFRRHLDDGCFDLRRAGQVHRGCQVVRGVGTSPVRRRSAATSDERRTHRGKKNRESFTHCSTPTQD